MINRSTAGTNRYIKIAFFIIYILFCWRVIGLDRDLPNFGLTFYQSKDEGQYSMMALNYYNYNNFLKADDFDLTILPIFRTNILASILQYFFLILIGDNYYGFRLAYTTFALLNMILIHRTLNLVDKRYNVPLQNKKYIFLLLLLVSVSFPYLMMSRCVENTAIRAFITIFMIYCWIKKSDCMNEQFFLLGLTSILAIFFVYLSNVHILLASIIILAVSFYRYIRKKDKTFWYKFSWWIRGLIVGNILSEVYFLVVWKSECWSNLFSTVFRFSDRTISAESQTGNLWLQLKDNAMAFLASNMFFFNFSLLALGILSFYILFNKYRESKDENMLLILSLEIAFTAQAFLTNDWMERKSICIYPVILISIYAGIICYQSQEIKAPVKGRKLLCVIYVFILLVSFLALFYYRYENNYFTDFEKADIYVAGICVVCELLCILIMLFFYNKEKKKTLLTISIVFGISMVMNLYFDLKYVYFYKSYTEKEIMVEIGKVVGDDYVAGPYTYGYTLYNDIKPVWNADNFCQPYIEYNKITYFVDYSQGPYYVNHMIPGKNYELIKSYPRALITMGKKYPIGLFKLKLK